jgi:hypothetical protein
MRRAQQVVQTEEGTSRKFQIQRKLFLHPKNVWFLLSLTMKFLVM